MAPAVAIRYPFVMTLRHPAVLLWLALAAATIGSARSAIEASIPIPHDPPQAVIVSRVAPDPESPPAPEGRSDEEVSIESIVRSHRPTAEDAWVRALTEAVYFESLAANADPLMIASIVASESSFQSRVVSHVGAVGLMQLRPFVARDVAERRQVAWNGMETLYAPDVNVRLGVLYFNELVERFDGDVRTALTAYNYGPTRVSRMIRAGTYDGSRYADAILERYERLRLLRAS